MDKSIVAKASAWPLDTIESYLTQTTIPCRLSCITADSEPHVMSLWYLYADGAVYMSVQRNILLVRWLSSNPRCGFEIAGDHPPYTGVRGRGVAELIPTSEKYVLPQLIERYRLAEDSSLANWLLSRHDTELTLRVTPHWVTSWDYVQRMGGD